MMNDILDFRYYDQNKQFQYKVKWHDFDRDDDWYNIDRNEFDIVVDVTIDFHQWYLYKSKLVNNAEMTFTINFFKKVMQFRKLFYDTSIVSVNLQIIQKLWLAKINIEIIMIWLFLLKKIVEINYNHHRQDFDSVLSNIRLSKSKLSIFLLHQHFAFLLSFVYQLSCRRFHLHLKLE